MITQPPYGNTIANRLVGSLSKSLSLCEKSTVFTSTGEFLESIYTLWVTIVHRAHICTTGSYDF